MPIKKECTCKPHKDWIVWTSGCPTHDNQPVEEQEWEDKLNEKFRDLRDEYPEKFSDIEQFIKSLLLSKEEEWKREQEILINTIIATFIATLKK